MVRPVQRVLVRLVLQEVLLDQVHRLVLVVRMVLEVRMVLDRLRVLMVRMVLEIRVVPVVQEIRVDQGSR